MVRPYFYAEKAGTLGILGPKGFSRKSESHKTGSHTVSPSLTKKETPNAQINKKTGNPFTFTRNKRVLFSPVAPHGARKIKKLICFENCEGRRKLLIDST